MSEERLAALSPFLAAPGKAAARAPRLVGWRGGIGVILPVLCVLLWQLVAARGWVEADLLPGPVQVGRTLLGMAQDGSLAADLGATGQRLEPGFLFGALAAMVVGTLTGASLLARRFFDPLLQALRNVPSLAWVPLFIIRFGIYDTSKILLIAVGVFFPVYLNLNGIAEVDRKLIEVGRIHGYGRLALMWRVQLPACSPAYWRAISVFEHAPQYAGRAKRLATTTERQSLAQIQRLRRRHKFVPSSRQDLARSKICDRTCR